MKRPEQKLIFPPFVVKQRDEYNNDQRRTQIQTEIRQIEEKMDKIKRTIDDDSIVLERLKTTADAQSIVSTLEAQVAKALESLDELINDEAVFLEKQGFTVPDLSNASDQDPDQIPASLEKMLKAATNRHDDAKANLDQSMEKFLNSQRLLSEKSALFASSQKTLASLRVKLQHLSTVTGEWNAVQESIRPNEAEFFGDSDFVGGDLVAVSHHIEKQLAKLEDHLMDVVEPEATTRLVRKLAKWIKKRTQSGKICPCCQQNADAEELEQFLGAFMAEGSELIKKSVGDSSTGRKAKSFYENVRKKIGSLQGGLHDVARISEEISELENGTKRLQEEISQCNDTLKSLTSEKDTEQSNVDDIRGLMELIRRWIDDANRISEKRLEIQQKRLDLSAASGTDGDKDLRTVDREIVELREEKDNLAAKINRLNKEVTEINRRISDASTRVSLAFICENFRLLTNEKRHHNLKALRVERKRSLRKS
jgi:chromosome segregation ATPase